MIRTGLGQDSHRLVMGTGKPLMIGGVNFGDEMGFSGNSDGDVLLHAITNAISSITGKPILGPVADEMCKKGTTDSSAYLQVALEDLNKIKCRMVHVAASLECARPKILPKLDQLRSKISELLGLKITQIGITATSGEGLTSFGKGEGVQAFCMVTVDGPEI